MRPPPEWMIKLAINGKTITERCSCGASTERLAGALLDPFAEWREQHACPDRPEPDEAPSANDVPMIVDGGDPADPVGFRLLNEEEP